MRRSCPCETGCREPRACDPRPNAGPMRCVPRYDAADGGTTASVCALIDGRTLVYAAAGDSCGLLGLSKRGGGAPHVDELVPEHAPTNLACWERLRHTGVHVVFDHEAMFDDQPHNLLPIFTDDGKGGWEIAQSTLERADELGCGLKTERGDRASVVMTPEDGTYSQMMLGVTRSVGDFYHQKFGVTWKPEVVVKDLHAECEAQSASAALVIVASDGVWDHWSFDEAMAELITPGGGVEGAPMTSKQKARPAALNAAHALAPSPVSPSPPRRCCMHATAVPFSRQPPWPRRCSTFLSAPDSRARRRLAMGQTT